MARIKVDRNKLEVSGSEELSDVMNAAPEGIQAICKPAEKDNPFGVDEGTVLCSSTVSLVVLTEDSGKQFGTAFLKLKTADEKAIPAIVAEIQAAGPSVVVDLYNQMMRDRKQAFLESNFGDVSKAINEGIEILVKLTGMSAEAARASVIKARIENGMRVPAADVPAEA